MARRVAQISAVFGIDIEEQACMCQVQPGIRCLPGTIITFSSKQASKKDNPVWIFSGKCDTTQSATIVSSRKDTINPNIKCRVWGNCLDSHLIQPSQISSLQAQQIGNGSYLSTT